MPRTSLSKRSPSIIDTEMGVSVEYDRGVLAAELTLVDDECLHPPPPCDDSVLSRLAVGRHLLLSQMLVISDEPAQKLFLGLLPDSYSCPGVEGTPPNVH